MSHSPDTFDDDYDLDPKEVLSQYSVEWITLRKSFTEVKAQLAAVQSELNKLDKQLENGEISEKEHVDQYHEKWRLSTEMIQVKREVEGRLFDIQQEIRKANKRLKQLEIAQSRRQRVEEEKSSAMVEWMSLKQGFSVVKTRRQEINTEMDKIELQRREASISDDEYRTNRLAQLRSLAELSTVESDVKRRLSELLELIRK